MYPLTAALVEFLQSCQGGRALAELATADLSDGATLSLLTRLRERFAPDQAAALLDQARLRRKVGGKFPQPERLLFTDEALQQASSRAVAQYRAAQFAALSPARVADLGCGIGADTVALAEAGLRVLAVERDPVRARIAEGNVSALGLADRVEVRCVDWTALSFDPQAGGEAVAAAFVDPGRRRGGRRLFSLRELDPPIAAVDSLRRQVADVAVKTAPGIADDEIPPQAEVEFISERGDMKEALLRFGRLQQGAARTATLLPGPYHLDSNAPLREVSAREPGAYFYEPDPAVIRATLVQHLATGLGLAQVDPTIAYLTGDQLTATPFARAWPVLRHGPFHLKTLNRWLREAGAGEVIVKKRGSAIDPETFRRRLQAAADGPTATIFLTRMRGRPWMVLAGPAVRVA